MAAHTNQVARHTICSSALLVLLQHRLAALVRPLISDVPKIPGVQHSLDGTSCAHCGAVTASSLGSTWLESLEGEKRSSAWRERLYRTSKGLALTLLTVLFRALHAN